MGCLLYLFDRLHQRLQHICLIRDKLRFHRQELVSRRSQISITYCQCPARQYTTTLTLLHLSHLQRHSHFNGSHSRIDALLHPPQNPPSVRTRWCSTVYPMAESLISLRYPFDARHGPITLASIAKYLPCSHRPTRRYHNYLGNNKKILNHTQNNFAPTIASNLFAF